MKIIYCSNAGHAKKYAEFLATKLNTEILSIDEISKVDKKEEIIFVSWVFASHINKLKKVKDYNVKVLVAVGMNKPTNKNTKDLLVINGIEKEENFFYLQGGVDYNKLRGFKKMLLKMVGNKVIKDNRKEDKEIIEVFKNGGNFVKKENLDEIIKYLNKK